MLVLAKRMPVLTVVDLIDDTYSKAGKVELDLG